MNRSQILSPSQPPLPLQIVASILLVSPSLTRTPTLRITSVSPSRSTVTLHSLAGCTEACSASGIGIGRGNNHASKSVQTGSAMALGCSLRPAAWMALGLRLLRPPALPHWQTQLASISCCSYSDILFQNKRRMIPLDQLQKLHFLVFLKFDLHTPPETCVFSAKNPNSRIISESLHACRL